MILGIDAGTSAVKLAVLEGDRVVRTHYERNFGGSVETLCRAMWNSGIRDMELEAVGVTGLNSENCCAQELGLPLLQVSEIEAIGRGGCFLSGRERALLVNLGTGSTFVLADGGKFTHVGGTGLGGGTLTGLSRRLLGITDPAALTALAMEGDPAKVDLRIGDLFSGSETLDPAMTASNLAKFDPDATDADWAAGLFNLVLECVGTMSLLACQGSGADTVVVLGALAAQAPAARCFRRFDEMYAPSFLLTPHGDCATAVGTALAVQAVQETQIQDIM